MKKLRIISWNVNGIRAAIKKGLWGKITNIGADIVCLQETKANPTQVDLEPEVTKTYLPYWNSAKKAGYSGVATFTKAEPKTVIIGDSDNNWDDEGRVLITKFDEFTLINTYFPNGKRDKGRLQFKLDFYEYYLKYIKELKEKGEKVIFLGDVNTAHEEIDLARPRDNSKTSGFLEIERKWIDKVIAEGWLDSFRIFNAEGDHYTWWDQLTGARKRNVGWRIDYIFVDGALKDQVKSAFILPEIEGSDHCPVGIELEL